MKKLILGALIGLTVVGAAVLGVSSLARSRTNGPTWLQCDPRGPKAKVALVTKTVSTKKGGPGWIVPLGR